MSQPEKFRTLKHLSIAVAFIVVVLIALPYGVKYGAIYGLKEAGATAVVIDDIDLNLFTGVLTIKQLQVGEKEKPDLQLSYLQIDVAYMPLFDKHFLLEAVRLEGVHLNVREQQGQLHVVVPIPVPEPEEEAAADDSAVSWGVGLGDVILRDVVLNVSVKGVASNVRIKKLDVSTLYSWAPSDKSALLLEGEVNGAPLSINGNVQPFAETPEYKTHLKIDALNLSPLTPFLKEYIQSYDVNVSLDTDLRIVMTKEGAVEVSQKGELDIDISSLVHDDVELKDSHVGWEGEVRLELLVDAEPLVKTEGKLTSRALNADFPAFEMGVKHQGVTWQGSVSVDAGDVGNSIQATGALALSELMVVDHKESISPVVLQHFALEDVLVAGLDTIALGQVDVQRLALLSSPSTSVLSLNDISVQKVQLKQKKDIAIDNVIFNGLAANITLLEDGELDVINAYVESVKKRLNASLEKKEAVVKGIDSEVDSEVDAEVDSDVTETGLSFQFSLNEFRFDGENNIQFSDLSAAPHYSEILHIDTLVIGPVNSKEKSTLTLMDVALRVGEFSSVVLKGALTPLQESVEGKLDLVVKGVELTKVSPYAEKAIGYAIGSGQFNLDTAVVLVNGRMQATNEVLLKQLVLTPVNEELIASVSKQFTMPIGISLGLLKDSDGNIELSVPLEGDLNDPSVNVAYVVRLALVQAIKKGSLSYLKYAIQPYGAILLVGETLGEMAMEVTVAPLGFVAGSSDIVEQDQSFLPKFAVLLNSVPEKSVTMCPVVTVEDGAVEGVPSKQVELKINDALKALAASRLAKIKTRLVSDHGIAPERILFCRAQGGEGQPRVEFEL